MKCLYFLLIVVAVQGFVVEPREKTSLDNLSAPYLVGFAVHDDSWKVIWNKVTSPQSFCDPVLGYIVKVSKVRHRIYYHYDIVNDKGELAETTESVEPIGTPREIKVEGADITEALIGDIKTYVKYRVQVQAYTRNTLGPLSSMTVLKDADGGDITEALIGDIKTYVKYRVQVQAYTKNTSGPLSCMTVLNDGDGMSIMRV